MSATGAPGSWDSFGSRREASRSAFLCGGFQPPLQPHALLCAEEPGIASIGMKRLAELPWDSSTTKHYGRRFGLHTKAAGVLIAFSVITKKGAKLFSSCFKNDRLSRSANLKHRGVAWKDVRLKKKKSVAVSISGKQRVPNLDLQVSLSRDLFRCFPLWSLTLIWNLTVIFEKWGFFRLPAASWSRFSLCLCVDWRKSGHRGY